MNSVKCRAYVNGFPILEIWWLLPFGELSEWLLSTFFSCPYDLYGRPDSPYGQGVHNNLLRFTLTL